MRKRLGYAVRASEREALLAATADLERSEAEDVATLAASFRSGAKPQPRTQEVERARASLHEHQRRAQAAAEAVSALEGELGDELQRSRKQWLAAVEREAEKECAQCRAHLVELRSGLERLAVMSGVVNEVDRCAIATARAR